MIPKTVKHFIVTTMAATHFTDEADMQQKINVGITALVANDFLDAVSRKLGSSAVQTLTKFYRDCLGHYSHVAVETNDEQYAIRFCNIVERDGMEGAELSFEFDGRNRKFKCFLYRIVYSVGVTSRNRVAVIELD